MDAILALDIAVCILAVTEFIQDLGSEHPVTTTESQQTIDSLTVENTLKRLSKDLHHVQSLKGPSVITSRLLNDERVLRGLLSCRDDCIALLKFLDSIMEESRNNSTLDSVGRAWLRSRLIDKGKISKAEQLSQDITGYVALILRSQVFDMGQTVQKSQGQGRYTRPEQESQVEALSRDLEHLGQSKKQPDSSYSTIEVKQIMTQLSRLRQLEDALLAKTIVSSLNYSSRATRFESIPQAHKNTLQWAFDSRLSEWLSSGSGIFWISGKPGSGKSTFIKFIAKHSQTKELLSGWAGSSHAVAIAAHYFWISGTPIQKSWQGLLQSLLFDLLHRHPQMVSLVSPNRWAAAQAGQWQTAAEPWSVSELSVALRTLATTPQMPLKMCFFIDGLDEYDSNHTELCEVLHDLASSPHIKMCVSSRRWDVFEERFSNNPKTNLEIHELTRNDIRNFVNDQLISHPRWIAEDSDQAVIDKAELMESIVSKADGVFLWAFLVTQSLREGLSDNERVGLLSKRFNQLPTDLDQLFQHMLESVNREHHTKMAVILQATIDALEPLHIDLYWQLERRGGLDHDTTTPDTIISSQEGELVMRRKETTHSITNKTKGLLRVVFDRVEFLHRTVKDFVLTKSVGQYLNSKLPVGYNGFVSIAAAYFSFLMSTTAQKKTGLMVADIMRQGRGINTGPFIAHLNQALIYVSEALKQIEQHRNVERLIDEYESAFAAMVMKGRITIRGANSENCNPKLIFREELLRHDLTPYLTNKIQQQSDYFDIFDESPLYAALMPMSRNSSESPAPALGILDLLLGRGYDPNVLPRQAGASYIHGDAPSPWVLYARGTMSVFNILSGPCMFPALRWNDSLSKAIFIRLISHGADPNKPLLDRRGARTVFSHFLDISLSKFLGEECFQGYLDTLDVFLRAQANLGIVPDIVTITGGSASAASTAVATVEAASGNLARPRPQESILTSFCTDLKGLLLRLVADPQRATFVSSVVEKLIIYSHSKPEDLAELESAISQGLPASVAEPLSRQIASELLEKQLPLPRDSLQKKRLEYEGDSYDDDLPRAKYLKRS